jgi:hypothetical protein
MEEEGVSNSVDAIVLKMNPVIVGIEAIHLL